MAVLGKGLSESSLGLKANIELDGSSVVCDTIAFCAKILDVAKDLISFVGIEGSGSLVRDVL